MLRPSPIDYSTWSGEGTLKIGVEDKGDPRCIHTVLSPSGKTCGMDLLLPFILLLFFSLEVTIWCTYVQPGHRLGNQGSDENLKWIFAQKDSLSLVSKTFHLFSILSSFFSYAKIPKGLESWSLQVHKKKMKVIGFAGNNWKSLQ